VHNILAKLQLTSRSEAASFAQREGFVPVSSEDSS